MGEEVKDLKPWDKNKNAAASIFGSGGIFFGAPMAAGLRILPIEEGYYETVELRARHRDLRAGIGLGILVAAIFPVGCLMFIVAFCSLPAAYAVCGKERRERIEDHRLKAPAFLAGF